MPLVTNGPQTTAQQVSMNRSENHALHSLDPSFFRTQESMVYLFTISKREFVARTGVFPSYHIPACPADERYTSAGTIAHPLNDIKFNPDDPNEPKITPLDGRKVAMDVCNPANTTLNQDTVVNSWFQVGLGSNLSAQGVFWSMNKVPTEFELKAAEKRRETYYRALRTEITRLESSSPGQVADQITEDHHHMADYFGETFSWHKPVIKVGKCPNCKLPLDDGAAFHFLPNGRICVNDWRKAVEAGVVDRKDVPEGKGWAGRTAQS